MTNPPKREKDAREVTDEIRRHVRLFTSDAAAARSLGVSRSHLCRLLSGDKPLTARVAAALGYEQITRYRRLSR